MKKQVWVTIPILLAMSFHTNVRAQDPPSLDPTRVPIEGPRDGDFVPPRWKISARVDDDLNGDRLPDHVLQIVPDDYDSSGVNSAPEAQSLLILLSSGKGRLERAVIADKLLMSFVPQYILQMSIKRGVLVINQNYGMTDVTDVTHRFRYEPSTRRFQLIGKDTFLYHRPQGPKLPATRISENYLTGVKVTTTERRLRNAPAKPTVKREQLPHSRIFIEDVDEDPDN